MHQSCPDRAGRARENGQLRAHTTEQGAKVHKIARHGLVHVEKAENQDSRSIQMEGPAECARRPASTWCSLLGHLRPSGDLANSVTFLDPIPHTRMAKLPT